jgi:glycosyltransferase involved in cell wall biosynthesis
MRAPIRLAFFIDDFIVGGTQTWLALLVRALAVRGFEMRVYCMRAHAHPENVRRLSAYATVEIIGESRLWTGVGLVHLARALKTWPADIVQTLLPTSDMVGRTLARLVGVPVIFSSIRGRAADKPGWQRWLDRRTARWAQAVVFNNREGIPDALQQEGIRPHQVVYIPNAVEVLPAQRSPRDVRGELQTPPEATVIGTVARLHPAKSQEDLLRAFAVVRRHVPDAVLWLIGDGERRGALEQEAQRLGVAAHVRMPGTRLDVRDILEAMDLFALPSRWEGMPNALMEAMAAGRPVVASDIDGIRELIRHGETGWRVPSGNPDELAQTMIGVLADRARAARVGQAALAHIQQGYSLDRMADAYAQLYREGLDKSAFRRERSRR